MPECNGSGTTDPGGCCYVAGEVCIHKLDNVGGRRHACGIVVKLLAERPELANDKAALDEAWDNDPEYLAYPAPVWRALEIQQERTSLSYQCSTWGPEEKQCCFRET